MSFIAALGWVILGTVAVGVLVIFWEKIKEWLNNFVSDLIERKLGYKAREKMHRAVVKVDRVKDKVRNKSTIYTKENDLDTHFLKTEVVVETGAHNIDSEILDEIRAKRELVQEYEYRKGV